MATRRAGAGTKGVPRADREQQMLDAAAAEFAAHGFAHASMALIAQGAGISKPLVYDYFGSKEGLYLACLNRAGKNLVDHVAAAQRGTSLKRALDTLAAIFEALDGRRFDWAVVHDPTLPPGSSVHRAAIGFRRQLFKLAAEGTTEVLVGRGVTNKKDADLLAHVWSNVVTATVSWWLEHPEETAAAMTRRCQSLLSALAG